MVFQSQALTSAPWVALGELLSVCREISEEPPLLYGSMALNYYGSEQDPVDIDLLVPDAVEPLLIDSLHSLGYAVEPSAYLGTIYKRRIGSIEIHDFQKYSDDFFLFASPQHGCKWKDLLRFSIDSTHGLSVKVPSLQLAFVLYAKYLHDWVYLDSLVQSSPQVKTCPQPGQTPAATLGTMMNRQTFSPPSSC